MERSKNKASQIDRQDSVEDCFDNTENILLNMNMTGTVFTENLNDITDFEKKKNISMANSFNILNFRSTSHHNLFALNPNVMHTNQQSKDFLNVTDNLLNNHLIFKEKADALQTARSNFDSVDNERERDYEIDPEMNVHMGTDMESKLLTTSMTNSFTTIKKQELAQTDLSNLVSYNNYNLSSSSSNMNFSNNKEKHNSDQKTNKGNLYLYQTTERGVDVNTLTRTIEKLGSKVNPVFFRSGFTQNVMRSVSKTPKQNKPKVLGCSPRNNIHYVYNEKDKSNNIIIIKSEKNLIRKRPQDDRKNSKNSSLSKDKRNTFTNYQSNKTLEDDQVKIYNISKYKEYVKGKLKVGGGNSHNAMQILNIQNMQNLQTNSVNNSNNQFISAAKQNPKNKANNNSYSKTDDLKRKIIHKDSTGNTVVNVKESGSGSKKTNKSIDRKIFENRTNAQTKISVDELLSFKKNEKNRSSPTHLKEKVASEMKQSTKTNFLNIKYV